MNDLNSASRATFDLTDPDGLLFDDEPHLFVDLQASPIVFTVRGLQYFQPRFRYVGIRIAHLNSREDFERALSLWLECEMSLLEERIKRNASMERNPGPYSVLQSIVEGGLGEAEVLMARMERRKNTDLRIVGGGTREDPGIQHSS